MNPEARSLRSLRAPFEIRRPSDEGTPADAVEQRLAAAAARRQELKEQREQLAQRRTAGLKKRHAAKLARITASTNSLTQGEIA